jgi:hypothetical protein
MSIPSRPERTGIMMDDLSRIICDLNQSRRLQQIFGIPVNRALMLVADGNDLRIEEAGKVELTQEEAQCFTRVLDEVISARR